MSSEDMQIARSKASSHLELLPQELHIAVLTHLRATDLSALQQTCQTFNVPSLIHCIIHQFAHEVYPYELTQGFDTPIIGGEVNSSSLPSPTNITTKDENAVAAVAGKKPPPPPPYYDTFAMLQNMEMLVVARVLSRPEPNRRYGEHGFYVSKSWCRTALRWLDSKAVERREREELRLKKRQEEEEAASKALLDTNTSSTPNGKKKNKYNHKPRGNHNNNPSGSGKKKGKKLKRQERLRNNNQKGRNATVVPPVSNVNHDIVCEHGNLIYDPSNANATNVGGGRRSRQKCSRLVDKQAWRVLNKLYPHGISLSSMQGECVQCALEAETARRNEEALKAKAAEERKKPLNCPLVRSIYTRNRGVPNACLVASASSSSVASSSEAGRISPKSVTTLPNGNICPFMPGVYSVLPRLWCRRWRKYIKTGEGERPNAPDTSLCLCDSHKLPIIPPHLEAYLHGETPALYTTHYEISVSENVNRMTQVSSPVGAGNRLGRNLVDTEMIAALRASGLAASEIESQRIAMLAHQRQRQREEEQAQSRAEAIYRMSPEERHAHMNSQLDRENKVVVEILTEEEHSALEKYWPDIHSSYSLKFEVVESLETGMTEITWTTPPCRECDASGSAHTEFVVRNRCRSWANNATQKRR